MLSRPSLVLLVLVALPACGQKAPPSPDSAAAAAAPAVAASPPAPVAAAPDARAAACTADGEWTVAITLTGAEPPPEDKCNPAPKELRFKAAAGGKVQVEAPRKWSVEIERVEAAGCALEVSAHGPVKGSVGGGLTVTLEPGPDGFAGKGQWSEDEGACLRDATVKASRT